jgi:RNA polymerase sigma-70 factor (ECF subfamily)
MPRIQKDWIERFTDTGARRLRSLFRRRVRRADDVPDLVQELYLRLLRMPEDAAVSNPEAYVFTVAANLAREHAVLTGRQGHTVPHDAPEVEPELVFRSSIEEELDMAVRAARLHAVLEELSPKCRAAVVLHYRDGLTYAEVGLRTGVSANMVKKYIVQALEHCRKRMDRLRGMP